MTRRFEIEFSEAVWAELERRRGDDDLSHVVEATLREAFELDRHTIFQVSTSNALAEGVFAGAVTVETLKEHGDFGLGTFDQLDGELILIEGSCFRATGGGVVHEVDDDAEVPFAVVTRFSPDRTIQVPELSSLAALEEAIDRELASENFFFGVRVHSHFRALQMRAACRALPGEGLLEATQHQSEFTAQDVGGTLVGFWAPDYADTVGVAGYHFHFISDDRQVGGHVLGVSAGNAEVEIQTETSLHLAMPDTPEFRSADLSGDHREAIEQAETQSSRDL